jgi:exonuclease SbcC
MTINSEQVVNTLKARLQGVQLVGDGVLRGEKRYLDKAFAVFYVDFTGKIEERAQGLSEFQDRILGRHYFDSPNDLRWNSYLLLLADKNQFEGAGFKNARAALESDRNYARKFVITPEDLAAHVDVQSAPSQSLGPQSTDILATWAALLAPVGLNDVFGDGDIAPLIRGLADPPQTGAPTRSTGVTKQPSNDPIASGTLQTIQLERFRRYPKKTTFDCGKVNLIRGVNGVGKTTLLEAIEYFYCGGIRRSGTPTNARVLGVLKDTKTPIVTSPQTPGQTFRSRALSWYGRLGLKGNPLPEVFGVYNFLNTDAAVHLTTESDPSQREKDLSTLLIGAEAARVWGRIQRVAAGVPTERRGFERQVEALAAKVTSEKERLNTAGGVPRLSDELFAQLNATLSQLGWRGARPTKDQTLRSTPLDAPGLEAALLSALRLPLLSPGITRERLDDLIRSNLSWLERAETLSKDFLEIEKGKYDTQAKLQERLSFQTDVRLLAKYIETGYGDEIKRIEALRESMANITRQIGGLDSAQFTHAEIESESAPLAAQRRQVEGRARQLTQATYTAVRLFDAFKAEQSRADALAQELRAIAEQMLEKNQDRESCPLCHTRFPPGELRNHMFQELERGKATRETELAGAVLASRNSSEAAQRTLKDIDNLIQFCRRRKLSEDETSYGQALAALEEARQELQALKIELEDRTTRVRALEESGLESVTLRRLHERVAGQGVRPEGAGSIQSLLVGTEAEVAQLRSELAKFEDRSTDFSRVFDAFLTECGLEFQLSPKQAEDSLRQRFTNLREVNAAIQSLMTVLTIDSASPLSSIASALSVASGIQSRLRLALQSERVADTSIADAQKALDAALLAQNRTSDAFKRFQAAERVLEEILSLHSLEAVTRDVLKQNRAEVANIFAKIHSPHEFQVCASGDALLERVDTHESIKLDQISSGQRAAFALSLFLALNSRASRAPPVMIIDDPVAHVDDLNTLSFLDYLRDLAAEGQRQIFFATADEKLAALFTHKFSFLGTEDFKNYELVRE